MFGINVWYHVRPHSVECPQRYSACFSNVLQFRMFFISIEWYCYGEHWWAILAGPFMKIGIAFFWIYYSTSILFVHGNMDARHATRRVMAASSSSRCVWVWWFCVRFVPPTRYWSVFHGQQNINGTLNLIFTAAPLHVQLRCCSLRLLRRTLPSGNDKSKDE